MNIFLIFFLSTIAFTQDFAFDKEKGRAVPSFIGQIKLLKGKVFKKNAEGTQSIGHGERFRKEDILVTSEKSFAKVQLVDDTTIAVGPKSEFRFDDIDFVSKDQRKLAFTLIRGQITGNVRKKARPGDIKFKTKYTAMGVRGTYFLMNHQQEDALHIAEYALLSGMVDVSGGQSQEVLLKKGERLVVIHDSNKKVDANEKKILSPLEYADLSAEALDEEKEFKPFLPYFKKNMVNSNSPLYPLLGLATEASEEETASFDKSGPEKPHWKDNLQELNKKLRENQRR